MVKKAFITGICGQDGSFLAELLLSKGYEIHGLVRRVAIEKGEDRYSRINHIKDKAIIHSGDIQNYARVLELMDQIKPDEVYHLAAQSFVAESFEDGRSTFDTNIGGTYNILSAIRAKCPKCKFYFAGSSEQFGKVYETPQNENTKFYPRSPYGISKCTGYELTRFHRDAYGMFCCSGILFNHESERRGSEFVTRKISKGIADMKKGKSNVLILGNIDTFRDWGYAPDYVEAMWLMLQQDKPDDYVIATGETHSIREFIAEACKHLKMEYYVLDLSKYTIEDADKRIEALKTIVSKDKCAYVIVQHPRFYRAAEVDYLKGDWSKSKNKLGWKPRASFKELVKKMIEHDMNENSNI